MNHVLVVEMNPLPREKVVRSVNGKYSASSRCVSVISGCEDQSRSWVCSSSSAIFVFAVRTTTCVGSCSAHCVMACHWLLSKSYFLIVFLLFSEEQNYFSSIVFLACCSTFNIYMHAGTPCRNVCIFLNT